MKVGGLFLYRQKKIRIIAQTLYLSQNDLLQTANQNWKSLILFLFILQSGGYKIRDGKQGK